MQMSNVVLEKKMMFMKRENKRNPEFKLETYQIIPKKQTL